MALSLSSRSDFLVQSEIRTMSIECDQVGGINLSQGVCDTEVPLPVRRGAQEAIDAGLNSYTRYDGLVELRQALSKKLREYNDIDADPESEIIVSAGSTGAFYCTCLALLNPGDQVILFEPFYGYHLNTLIAAGAVPAYVTTTPPDWVFTERDLESACTPQTRAIVINTPANPTGKVWTRKELELVAAFAKKHDLFVLTDEIYEYILYDGRKHVSPATIPGMAERTITISGLSKTFSITGWRMGYAVASRRWAKMIGYINDLVYVCAPAPLQMGVARGIDALQLDYYRELRGEYERKRDLLCAALEESGLRPLVPQGAYYVLADLSRLPGATSKDRAMQLLRTAKVACVPGAAFQRGEAGELLGRFCFAKTMDELERACAALRRVGD